MTHLANIPPSSQNKYILGLPLSIQVQISKFPSIAISQFL